ncbi:hypothetical protein NG819_05450 [Pseudarthrobacter sp. Fe7]|nr:hypothetical protein NG819_05450 [Pseudarthrobacter sp. Fe7]
MIQMFDEHPRLLKDIGASDHVLVLLYWVGSPGVKRATLSQWLPLSMRTNLSRTLAKLHATHLVHYVDSTARITLLGEREVEQRGLVAPL